MVGGQKIQVGLPHARKTVAVTVGPNTYQVAVEPGITIDRPAHRQPRHQAAQGLQLRLTPALRGSAGREWRQLAPSARFAWISAISAFMCSRAVSPVRPRPAASEAPAGPPASMTPSSRCSVPM